MLRPPVRRFFSTGKPSGQSVPSGHAISNVTPLRKFFGYGLAGLGFASYAFMQYSPHDILSPFQFYFKNRGTVMFPIKETPHY